MKIIFLAGPFRGDGSTAAKQANIESARKYAQMCIEKEIPWLAGSAPSRSSHIAAPLK